MIRVAVCYWKSLLEASFAWHDGWCRNMLFYPYIRVSPVIHWFKWRFRILTCFMTRWDRGRKNDTLENGREILLRTNVERWLENLYLIHGCPSCEIIANDISHLQEKKKKKKKKRKKRRFDGSKADEAIGHVYHLKSDSRCLSHEIISAEQDQDWTCLSLRWVMTKIGNTCLMMFLPDDAWWGLVKRPLNDGMDVSSISFGRWLHALLPVSSRVSRKMLRKGQECCPNVRPSSHVSFLCRMHFRSPSLLQQ